MKLDCSVVSASFKYDALGRRIEKTTNGVTTQYLYDGLDIVQEKQGGVVSVNYVRTLNIDEPLMRVEAGGNVRYYHADGLGSVIALTDETGNVRTRYAYDPYGRMVQSGEASGNSFQYTGRENDGTGLYYYRARYYSTEMKRWISEDPIGFNGEDINLFRYVSNNPVNEIDPEGLLSIGDEPPSGNFKHFRPPEKLHCDSRDAHHYCGQEQLKKQIECLRGAQYGPCMHKVTLWTDECMMWALWVQDGDMQCPPKDCEDK